MLRQLSLAVHRVWGTRSLPSLPPPVASHCWAKRLAQLSSSRPSSSEQEPRLTVSTPANAVRLSKLLSSPGAGGSSPLSRREAERLIRSGEVTLGGEVVTAPHLLLSPDDVRGSSLKVRGKAVAVAGPWPGEDPSSSSGGVTAATESTSGSTSMRVWLAHKLSGELVTDSDPHDRPSLLQRLARGGVGRLSKKGGGRLHLKPVGRLDMTTEGLVVITSDGAYARELELPSSQLHRVYRARVHGHRIDPARLQRQLRRGLTVDGIRYGPMRVTVDPQSERRGSTNQWIELTCCEGKNRQVRKVLASIGLKVTRLIRTSYGDYRLDTIPPGMAIEVPVKPVDRQRKKGDLFPRRNADEQLQAPKEGGQAPAIQWIHRQ